MMVYAVANSFIGATPAAFAADVMPQSVSGFGLGMFRCAGDIGAYCYLARIKALYIFDNVPNMPRLAGCGINTEHRAHG